MANQVVPQASVQIVIAAKSRYLCLGGMLTGMTRVKIGWPLQPARFDGGHQPYLIVAEAAQAQERKHRSDSNPGRGHLVKRQPRVYLIGDRWSCLCGKSSVAT
jgi:hypothetical protein